MSINEIQDEIILEFSAFDDWMDKYAYLIELGNGMQEMQKDYKIDKNLIDGCQSKVWFNAELVDGKILFTADSDAIITKGIASLLKRILSGQTPEDILNAELYFIEKTGLQQHLSPTRSNGLMSMVKQLKLYALAYKSISK
ncbi:MAG: SufE family protein [Bacteroidales bacterium]|nr:SufE family protein [Bacteroidales bacterium]MDD3861248.1 SufE family protein [Bacteroidales bacterium]